MNGDWDSGWVLPQLCHRQAAKYFFSLCLSVFISKVGTVTFVLSGFSKEPEDKGNVGVQKLAVGLSVSSPPLSLPRSASFWLWLFLGWPAKGTEQDLGSSVSLLETKVSWDSRNTGR